MLRRSTLKSRRQVRCGEWKDGSAWKPFHPPDNGFLEKQYKIYGPKGTFVSTNFVFNAGYDCKPKCLGEGPKNRKFLKVVRMRVQKVILGQGSERLLAPVQNRFQMVQKTLGRPLLPGSTRPFAPSPNYFQNCLFSGPSHRHFGLQGYDTEYEINFESMVQKNLSSKKVRPLRRKDAAAAAKAPKWEWRTNQKTWAAYAEADAELLEKAYNAGTTPFETKELSFNKGFDSLYIFDFAVMTQV